MSYQPNKFLADPMIAELADMLSYRRPARSESEAEFIERFIVPLGVELDSYGNLYKRIGESPVLWSSHTDSVHKTHGRQRLSIDHDGVIALASNELESNCLGADCATGVWLMANMIRREVPGLYVFHRDEEIGGLGSADIAHNRAEFLNGIQFAIAFDRKGFDSVITYQFGERSASEKFALSFAAALGDSYSADPSGIFTDTAHYSAIVSECSNISVGYEGAHSPNETQDSAFARALLDKLCRLDQTRLIAAREPDRDEFDDFPADTRFADKNAPRASLADIAYIVRRYPDEVAELLRYLGFNGDSLFDEIKGDAFDF